MCLGCEGVGQVRVSLMAEKADVDYQSDMISADAIVQHVIEIGHGASLLDSGIHDEHGSVDLQVCCFYAVLFYAITLTSKVDGGITGSRLRWSILT